MKIIFYAFIYAAMISNAVADNNFPSADKSPNKALMYSTLGTFGPFVIGGVSSSESIRMAGALIGMIPGPGWGHLYAGNKNKFWRGITIRTLAFGSLVYGSLIFELYDDGNSGEALLMLGGAVVLIGSVSYDIATAKKSARLYNKNIRANHIIIQPVYFAKHQTAGIQLSITF